MSEPWEDPMSTTSYQRERAERAEALLPKCVCGAIATCFGFGESPENMAYACDDCCGHGNEDGRCVHLTEDPCAPAEVAQRWAERALEAERRLTGTGK
jgi:hypothetical protein